MSFNFLDPAFLIPLGVIIIGTVFFVWALGKLFKKSPSSTDFSEDAFLPTTMNDSFSAPPSSDYAAPQETRQASSRPGSGANREMADRLDGMAQKLSDMQNVLQRQATTSPAGAALTPETIDKLLKIIGNVTQQVDVLQKSLAAAPTLGVPVPAPQTATPQPAPPVSRPATPPTPVSAPPSSKPGVPSTPNVTPPVGNKPLGVTGGALSAFGRNAPASPKPGATPGGPPATNNPPPGK